MFGKIREAISRLFLIVTILIALIAVSSCDVNVKVPGVAGSGGGQTGGSSDSIDSPDVPDVLPEEEPDTFPEEEPEFVPSTLEELTEYRTQTQNGRIDLLTSYLDSSSMEALKKIYTLYDENLYIWLANLYDPEIGGFYYSNSAKENSGFLPDLESTRQALSILENSGLAVEHLNRWAKMLPDEIKSQIASYVRNMQDYSNGYFYHPQWGTAISTNRRSRDLMSATGILKALEIMPIYNTPNNVIGENPIGTEVLPSALELTSPLNSSTVSAVSKVVATASKPSHLTSETAFRSYMENIRTKLENNSYSVGNLLNSQVGEINAAGHHSILIEYLNSWQKDNGLWEDTVTYQSINGLMKISAMYYTDELKKGGKANVALNTVVDFLLAELDEDGKLTEEAIASVETICYVYNPWVIMDKLMGAISSSERIQFKQLLKEKGDYFIEATYRKLLLFKKDDGGFSNTVKYSSPTSQNAPVAVRRTAESDVNATAIAISSVLVYMLGVFGIEEYIVPDIYCKFDGLYFLELIKEATPAEKKISEPQIITFEDYIEDEEDSLYGVVGNPADMITNNVGDEDIENGKYKWFSSAVVPSPTDPTNSVLYAGDFVYTGTGKNVAEKGSSTTFKMANGAVDGNKYVFESDIYIGKTGNVVAQIYFATSTSNSSYQSTGWNLTVTSYSTTKLTLKFAEDGTYFPGANGRGDSITTRIDKNAWFKLRMEMTKNYDSNGKLKSISTDFYVNGVKVGTSDSARVISGEIVDYNVDSVRFAYYRSSASEFYFDNVYVAKIEE